MCNLISLDCSYGTYIWDKGGSCNSKTDPAPLFLRSLRTCAHISELEAALTNFTLATMWILTSRRSWHSPSTFKVTMRTGSEKSYEENSISEKMWQKTVVLSNCLAKQIFAYDAQCRVMFFALIIKKLLLLEWRNLYIWCVLLFPKMRLPIWAI